MHVVIAGATGFVGRRLATDLVAAGHDVRAGTRRPGRWSGPGRAVRLDLEDPASLAPALDGADVAYYLVHSLSVPRFEERDLALAHRFAAAAQGRVSRVVYLGGLGQRNRGSLHLRSRHEVGDVLAAAVPTVELRAAVVLGPGSASYELLRRLVERLTVGPGPRVVAGPQRMRARSQPIGVDDALFYLRSAPGLAPGSYDVGARTAIRYHELLELQAEVVGEQLRVLPVLPIAPRHFAAPVALLTGQDLLVTHALFTSAGEDALVTDGHRIVELTGHEPASLRTVLEDAAGRR